MTDEDILEVYLDIANDPRSNEEISRRISLLVEALPGVLDRMDKCDTLEREELLNAIRACRRDQRVFVVGEKVEETFPFRR